MVLIVPLMTAFIDMVLFIVIFIDMEVIGRERLSDVMCIKERYDPFYFILIFLLCAPYVPFYLYGPFVNMFLFIVIFYDPFYSPFYSPSLAPFMVLSWSFLLRWR